MKRRFWTEDELAALRLLYPSRPTAEVAQNLNRSERSTYAQANLLGLKKSAEYLAGVHSKRFKSGEAGKRTQFKKGQKPWNKGKKGLMLSGPETQFKPGHVPHNTQPVGSERICSKDGYLIRKVRDTGVKRNDWAPVHIWTWEQHNGPVPDGHIVVFRDGNKQNIVIENLELITRAENMRRNSYHNYPKEIARLIQLRGAVNRQINKRASQ